MIRRWIARHVIADDTNPQYSRLDKRDELVTDQEAFDALAQRMFPGGEK